MHAYATPSIALGASPRAAASRRSAVRPLRAVESSAPTKLEGEALETYMSVLAEDLSHLFDSKGVDKSLYSSTVSFESGKYVLTKLASVCSSGVSSTSLVMALQPVKAVTSMVATELGMVTEASAVQPLNIYLSSVRSLLGMITEMRDLHSLNES